jgi:exodeoxyribonuclease V alpha subunit
MKKRAAESNKVAPASRPLKGPKPSGGSLGSEARAGGTPALLRNPFSELDRQFAQFIERLAGGNRPELALAAALVSFYRGQGHICLDLASVAGKPWPERAEDRSQTFVCPRLDSWRTALRAAPVVGAPGEFTPLILDAHGRLYLHRYWEYETALANEIKRRAAAGLVAQKRMSALRSSANLEVRATKAGRPATALNEWLDRLFPDPHPGELDWQRAAALAATRKHFCVISGGPGTGKTRTLVRILALLLETAQSDGQRLRFAVAAPTGKAAARIQDELRKAKEQLPCDDTIKAQLPEEAMTIHRLLGAVPDSAYFRHDGKNPLPADVVVVDEASMVDLALMAKLFAAVPPSAKIILLGDKDQLASVAAGAVLGDICAGAEPQSKVQSPESNAQGALAECIVQLRKNYRFGQMSAIQRLGAAINAGDPDQGRAILEESRRARDEVGWAPLPGAGELKLALKEKLLAGLGPYLLATEPWGALEALGQFRILCAVREGPYGVRRLNELAEEVLEEEGLIRRTSLWYARRPVLVTRNDYNLRLFNGDTGAILPDPETGQPRACFPGTEHKVRQLLTARLPACETVYAMTVHKSQGSEFMHVLLVLPERDSPLLTRELLYTGLSRARAGVELWCGEAIFRAAVARRVERTSGLREALWSGSQIEPRTDTDPP